VKYDDWNVDTLVVSDVSNLVIMSDYSPAWSFARSHA